MKKIILSLGTILFAGTLLAGGTGAFLADSGTSTGNTFATGVIDLKVDNESYVTNNDGVLIFSPNTSWALSKLAGKLFFNFLDLKPGDVGEDTISLHVNNNNAWACMNVAITATPENGQNEPEAAVDPTAGVNDGELQNNLNFVFWADDGDNVYEVGEKIFKQGIAKDIFDGKNWALADASTNIWTGSGPIPGDTVQYIGKAWCFGSMSQTPKSQDGKGKTGTNGPLVRGTGFSCSGADVGNIVQSDGIQADVSFSVAQSRNNSGYLCSGQGEGNPPPNHSTVTLFSDTFDSSCREGREFNKDDNGKWDKDGEGHVRGGDDHGGSHNKFADLSSGYHRQQSLTTGAIKTTGYNTIVLKYDRSTLIPNGTTATFTVEYSVNGGGSWTTLETVTASSPWTTKTWSLSPSADNKPNVQVRFKIAGSSSSDHAYVDNVVVTGVSI